MTELDKQIFDRILNSLDEIGKTKSVGYLPYHTIKYILHDKIDRKIKTLVAQGLKVRLLNEDETCIKSGALFAYDPNMILKIINSHKKLLVIENWPFIPEFVIDRISKEWFASEDPIMPFIKDLYNDK